jgi:hypothetical protein
MREDFYSEILAHASAGVFLRVPVIGDPWRLIAAGGFPPFPYE